MCFLRFLVAFYFGVIVVVLFACLFACSAVLCVMCMYHCTVMGTLGGRFVCVRETTGGFCAVNDK